MTWQTKTVKLKRWAGIVKTRDNNTCQVCSLKRKKKDMDAHHLEAQSSRPDLRYEVNNGITLCKPDHQEFHRIYGRNNTTEQFIDYVESKGLTELANRLRDYLEDGRVKGI